MSDQPLRSLAAGVLRVALGVALLCTLLWYSDPAAIWALFRGAPSGLLLLIPLLSLARIWLLVRRFEVLVRPIRSITRAALARQFLAGAYANNFLPTAIGGDAVRVVMLRQEQVSPQLAVSLVLVERAIGFSALVALSALGALLVDAPACIRALIAALAAGTAIAVAASRRLLPHELGLDRGTLVSAFAWSLVLQVCSIGSSVVVGTALGARLPAATYLALVPLVWVVTMLPVTIGGLGLREAAFVYLFGSVGVSAEVSLAISLGTYAGLLFTGLLGAAVLARRR